MKLILIAAAASVAFVTGALASAPVMTKATAEATLSKPDANATIVATGPTRSNGRGISGIRSSFGG
ncbi:hypothetical protein F9K79_03610 [Ochrobactrum sp. Kaboul]|jgi:hypothetical protein|nr:hypothetical protein F9K79_03610 [Ochrobactrum sp. Kaboul]